MTERLASSVIEQNTCPPTLNTKPIIVAKLAVSHVTFRFFNDAVTNLILYTMQCLGSVSQPYLIIS